MSCATPILPSGPLGHVPEMPGHVAEIAGHDPEKAGHVRPKYACMADCGLLAVLVRKLFDHLHPYYQRVIYGRNGLESGRLALADWPCLCGALPRTLVGGIRRYEMAGPKV